MVDCLVDTVEETAWTLFRSLETKAFKLLELYLGDFLERAGYSVVLLGKRLCTIHIEVSNKLFESVDFYPQAGLEMAVHSVVRLREKLCIVTVVVFSNTELSELVYLDSGDGLEMTGPSVVTLGRQPLCRDC